MDTATQMPDLLTTDDFHTYAVKLATIGPCEPYQIQLLCANTAVWNDLEKVHKAAVAMKKYMANFDEAVRLKDKYPEPISIYLEQQIRQDFMNYYKLDSVAAIEKEGVDKAGKYWRRQLVQAIFAPMENLFEKCVEREVALEKMIPGICARTQREQMLECERTDPEGFKGMFFYEKVMEARREYDRKNPGWRERMLESMGLEDCLDQ